MLGFLKNIFSKPEEKSNGHSHSAFPDAPVLRQPAAPAPAQTFAKPSAVSRPPSPAPAAPVVSEGGRRIELPLHAILNGLPLELKARIRKAGIGDLTFSIPLETALAELALGAVKISFGELRTAVPGVFAPETDRDHILIPLPLNEILARINPALLSRRSNQKQIEVPDEISSPFDSRGQGLSLGAAKPAAPISAPVRTVTPAPIKPVAPMAPPPVAPAPETPLQPVQPIAFRNPLLSTPTPPPPAAPPSGTPPSIPAPVTLRGVGGLTKPTVPAIQTNGFSTSKPTVPTPATEAGDDNTVTVPLGKLCEGWPEPLRLEILQLNLMEARVVLPGSHIVPGLKQGRVVFTWKMVRGWIQPALATVSLHDNTAVELPLKVVAPLFLSRKTAPAPTQRRVVIDENIPNLFFGFPQPDSSPAEVPPPVQSRAVVKPDTNYYVWDDTSESAKVDETEFKRGSSTGTDFLTRYATPNEVVSRASALDGVAGALIALPDGLMVASKLAPDLNGDTLAAFLPHIFGKVSQCTKELRMGDLNNLNFTVGNVPWKIFRVNAIFFAAFGQAGQPLPGAELAALAAELDRKKK